MLMTKYCQSSIRQVVSEVNLHLSYLGSWFSSHKLRSRNMRGKEQKVMLFMLWCIVSVTDLTAAMWNAAGSDTHIDSVGQLHHPPSPLASSIHPSSHHLRLTWNDTLHVISRLQKIFMDLSSSAMPSEIPRQTSGVILEPTQLHAESFHDHCLIRVSQNIYPQVASCVYYSAMGLIMCQKQVLKTLL